jgi:hypothetical protein
MSYDKVRFVNFDNGKPKSNKPTGMVVKCQGCEVIRECVFIGEPDQGLNDMERNCYECLKKRAPR